jgi:hypothetical protein
MRSDFTPDISLTQPERRIYIMLRIVLFAGLLCAGLFFIKELLLPTYIFRFNAAIDSLANTITRPVLDEQNAMFSAVLTKNVERVEVTISTTDALPHNTTLSLRKSYAAFLAPLGEESATTEEHATLGLPFPNNSLLKSSSGVFIIDDGALRAFDTEEAFLASGYDFDNIHESTSDERGAYSKGKIFSLTSEHPTDTLFYATDTKRSFRFVDGTLLHTVDADENVAITVQEASRSTQAICTLRKKILPRNTYTCTLDLLPILHFDGKRYVFTLNNQPHTQITHITTAFFTRPTVHNIYTRLAEIKALLAKQYQ